MSAQGHPLLNGHFATQLLALALIVAGTVLAWNPELLSHKPVPADPFEATERRIWWGLPIGLGLLLLFHKSLLPWGPTLAATGAALLLGMLIARLIGIALDGPSARQWLNVAIELALMAPLVLWYGRVRA